MRIIEPCCIHKQLTELIDELDGQKRECAHFFSFSDWDVKDFLLFLRNYVCGGELYISMITLDVPLITTIQKLLAATYIDGADKSKEIPYIGKMVLLVQPVLCTSGNILSGEIHSQLGRYIRDGRLVFCEDNIGFRCIALRGPEHSLVFQGSLNKERSGAMQMVTLTNGERTFGEVREMFRMKENSKRVME